LYQQLAKLLNLNGLVLLLKKKPALINHEYDVKMERLTLLAAD